MGSDAGCQIAAGLESGNLVRCKWAGAELLPTHQRMVVESRRWLCLAGDCFKFCCVFILQRPQQCCTAVSELPRVQKGRSDADLQEGSCPIKYGQKQPHLHNTHSLVLPWEETTTNLPQKTSAECDVWLCCFWSGKERLCNSCTWSPVVHFVEWHCPLAPQQICPFLPANREDIYRTWSVKLRCVFNEWGQRHWPPCCFIQMITLQKLDSFPSAGCLVCAWL